MAKFEREVDIDSKVEKAWQVLTTAIAAVVPGIDSIANVSAVQKAAHLSGWMTVGPVTANFWKSCHKETCRLDPDGRIKTSTP